MRTIEEILCDLDENKALSQDNMNRRDLVAKEFEAKILSFIEEYVSTPDNCGFTTSSNIYDPSVNIKLGNSQLYLTGVCNDDDVSFKGNMIQGANNSVNLRFTTSSINVGDSDTEELKMAYYAGLLANTIRKNSDKLKSYTKAVMEYYLPTFNALIRESSGYYQNASNLREEFCNVLSTQILGEMLEGCNFPDWFKFSMAIYYEPKSSNRYHAIYLPFEQVKFIKLETAGKNWYKVLQVKVESDMVLPKSDNFYLKKYDVDVMLRQLCEAQLKDLVE